MFKIQLGKAEKTQRWLDPVPNCTLQTVNKHKVDVFNKNIYKFSTNKVLFQYLRECNNVLVRSTVLYDLLNVNKTVDKKYM